MALTPTDLRATVLATLSGITSGGVAIVPSNSRGEAWDDWDAPAIDVSTGATRDDRNGETGTRFALTIPVVIRALVEDTEPATATQAARDLALVVALDALEHEIKSRVLGSEWVNLVRRVTSVSTQKGWPAVEGKRARMGLAMTVEVVQDVVYTPPTPAEAFDRLRIDETLHPGVVPFVVDCSVEVNP